MKPAPPGGRISSARTWSVTSRSWVPACRRKRCAASVTNGIALHLDHEATLSQSVRANDRNDGVYARLPSVRMVALWERPGPALLREARQDCDRRPIAFHMIERSTDTAPPRSVALRFRTRTPLAIDSGGTGPWIAPTRQNVIGFCPATRPFGPPESIRRPVQPLTMPTTTPFPRPMPRAGFPGQVARPRSTTRPAESWDRARAQAGREPPGARPVDASGAAGAAPEASGTRQTL